MKIGRLKDDSTDLKPYMIDGVVHMALISHEGCEKSHRYAIPSWEGQPPENRSIGLF